ncbi:Wzz/FepE/Etk N-terminal domain-containing protein [Pseudomonas muyukensis]|uniref:Polysaccharide chain length determinant N-terminal domain-containing protein n=1 Tax=Pseudomonas muyukensis TaxID=2842357 RepID=A0ABX8MDE8_9PSED|nr:Wzz/FepE/Etk N-terminal domain-containing protein [Pseudomonas muyukensis]QXH37102.1 hypothetical protein KSS95_09825 [Pseudomonas muyukensis]
MREKNPALEGGEIDLAILVREIWQGRYIVLLVALLAVMAAAVFVYLQKPLYEANTVVLPPMQDEIAALNIGRGQGSGLALVAARDVYDTYLRNLQSQAVRRRFYHEVYLPSIEQDERGADGEDAYRDFESILTLRVDRAVSTRFVVALRAHLPATAVDWVSRYIEMAGEATKQEVIGGVISDATLKADNLQHQIEIAQNTAQQERRDKILQLKDALRIARAVGLEKPPLISTNQSAQLSFDVGGGLAYMRGSQALLAEIENLEKRGDDAPFIADLRQKQADAAFYRVLKIPASTLKVYRQDGQIVEPERAVNRRIGLLFAGAVLAGLVLGVAVVMGRNALRRLASA